MRLNIYLFKRNYANYLNLAKETKDIIIKNSPIEECKCQHPRCSGKYIKTRPNQTTCLFKIIEPQKSTHNHK